MYETDILDAFLQQNGYKRFYASEDWLTIVKQKYQLQIEQTTNTIMDVRCPKVRELLDEIQVLSDFTIPEIEPILIHCGREGSLREDLQAEEKIITTPCKALADMGNAFGLKNTWFVPWNQFLQSIGKKPEGKLPEESPIPPGFFSELGMETVSVTGEEKIRKYLEKPISEEVQIVEMLFCKEGCHNGDGIRMCET